MYMWEEFDIGEVREDMAHIADMGFDVVRVFALHEGLSSRRPDVDADDDRTSGGGCPRSSRSRTDRGADARSSST